jgi:hypothetical protein
MSRSAGDDLIVQPCLLPGRRVILPLPRERECARSPGASQHFEASGQSKAPLSRASARHQANRAQGRSNRHELSGGYVPAATRQDRRSATERGHGPDCSAKHGNGSIYSRARARGRACGRAGGVEGDLAGASLPGLDRRTVADAPAAQETARSRPGGEPAGG